MLHTLGRVAYFEYQALAAREFGERSLAIAEQLADRWLIAWALHLLGLAAYIADDYLAAQDYYDRSLAIRRELGPAALGTGTRVAYAEVRKVAAFLDGDRPLGSDVEAQDHGVNDDAWQIIDLLAFNAHLVG